MKSIKKSPLKICLASKNRLPGEGGGQQIGWLQNTAPVNAEKINNHSNTLSQKIITNNNHANFIW